MMHADSTAIHLVDLLNARGSILVNERTESPCAEYIAQSSRTAKFWNDHHLIGPGDLIAIEGLAGIDLFAAVLTAWQLNAVPFPCDKLRDESFAGRTFRLSAQSLEIIMDGDADPRLARTAIVHRSSGSSGRSRLVRRSAESLLAEACRYKHALSLANRDQVLIVLPIQHSFAWGFLLGAMLAGCRVDLRSGFSPSRTAKELDSGRVSIVALTPTTARLLCARPGVPPAKPPRLAVVGAGPVDKGLEKDFKKRFRVGLARNYGSTETGAVFSGVAGLDSGIIGLPMSDVTVVEPPLNASGELVLALDPAVDGYLEAERTSLWRTGDLVERGADGLVRILGRLDTKLQVNGQSLDRTLIEKALLAHPHIEEVYLLSARRPATPQVEDLVAIVKCIGTSSNELLSYCANHLPTSHCPSRIILCDDLPKTQIGKPDLTAVLDRIAAERISDNPL